MDNFYVSKEIIHIKHNQPQTISENQDLLFLMESKQVVCTKCYKDHYHNQTAMRFKHKGTCQCLSSKCNEDDGDKYKLMVTYKEKDSEEIKTSCFGCTKKANMQIIEVKQEKIEIPHKCTQSWSKLLWDKSIYVVSDCTFLNFEKKKSIFRTFSFILDINATQKRFLSGFSLHLERLHCSLPTSFEFSKENIDFEAIESIMEVIVQSEIPWISTSPDLLFMIRKQTRKSILNNLRATLFSLFDDKQRIAIYLLDLFKQEISDNFKRYISLLLDEKFQIKALLSLSSKEQNFKLDNYHNQILFDQILDTLEENKDLAAKYKDEIAFMLTDGLAKGSFTTKEITKFKVLDQISEVLPIYNLKSEIRNKSELIDLSNSLHFQLKQFVYGDTQIQDALSQLEETFSTLKRLLCISGAIETSDYNSSLTSSQKVTLFYNTPVVNAFLMITQVLVEELYKVVKYKQHIPKLEEVISEAFSIMSALSEDCYDVSMLFFSNFKTLFVIETAGEPLRNKCEQFLCCLSKYLFGLSNNPYYLQELIYFKNETLHELFHSSWSIQRDISRIELTYFLGLTKETSISSYLLEKFYPSDSNIEDFLEYYFEEVKYFPSKTKISKKSALECFILSDVDSFYSYKKELLSLESKDSLHNNKKLIKESQIKQILVDEDLENYFKVMLATHFLLEKRRLSFDFKLLQILPLSLNSKIQSQSILKFETIPRTSEITFKVKRHIIKEKSEILDRYFSIALETIKEEPNLLSKLKMLNLVHSIKAELQEEMFLYELKVNNILDSMSSIIKQNEKIKSDPKLKEKVKVLEDLENYKKRNRMKVTDLESYLTSLEEIIFRNENNLSEITKKVTNGSKMVYNWELQVGYWFEFVSKHVFFEFSYTNKIEELNSIRITRLLKYKTEIIAKKCLNKLFELDNCSEIDQLLTNFDFIINLASKTQSFPIKIPEIKGILNQLGSALIYFFIQFSASVKQKVYIEIRNGYFNLLNKALQFLRVLVDGNNMEMRELLVSEEVEIDSQVILGYFFEVDKQTSKTTILEILVNCCNSLLNNSEDYEFEVEAYHKVGFYILELINEMIEGCSKFESHSCVEWFSKFINSSDELVIMKIEDFYLKICFDPTVNEEDKDRISKCLNNESLLQRMMKLKEIDFVSEILEDQKENKTERLLKWYYSENNKSFYKFKEIFRIFEYLRFNIDFDFKINLENEKDICFIEFMDGITKKVEISPHGKLSEIRFLDSPDSVFFTKENEKVYFEKVDRSSIVTKNQDLIDYSVHFRDEIKFRKEMKDNLGERIGNRIQSKWLVLACLGLCLIGIYIMFAYTDVASKELKDSAKISFLVLLILQLVCCLGALLLWGSINFRLIYNLTLMQFRTANNIDKGQENQTNKLICRLNAIASSLEPTCSGLILVTNILAISSSSLYWVVSLQLLCFIAFSKNLLNIVKAIQIRSKQLGLITIFLVFVLLIYGIITFNYMSEYFQTEDGDPLCTTLGHCLTSQIDFGFRMGGGMGDNMPVQEWQSEFFWRKFAYSTVHFVLFPVIMLNIVAGVIIDTFADLREQAAALEEDTKTICLICGGNKADISKEEGSYDKHIEEKHNIRNYMLFIKYILDKPEKELDYTETLIRKQIENKETNWLPSGEESVESQIKQLREEITNQTLKLNKKADDNAANIEKQFRDIIEKIEGLRIKQINKEKEESTREFKDNVVNLEKDSIELVSLICPEIEFSSFASVQEFSFKKIRN